MKNKEFVLKNKNKSLCVKNIEHNKKSLINSIKSIEIKDKNGLVFFGTCHCLGGTTGN